jgi:hypothetical protein
MDPAETVRMQRPIMLKIALTTSTAMEISQRLSLEGKKTTTMVVGMPH